MWIIVILSGMLNDGGGLHKGYSEMTDLDHYQFSTYEECEKNRQEITDYIVTKMGESFGDKNVLAVSACWEPETPA